MFTAIPFLLAFCSMIYELVIAQYLSLYFGGTVFNFTLTIGLFLFSMGIGAISTNRYLSIVKDAAIEKAEITLSALGLLTPFITCFLGSYALNTSSAALHMLLFCLCYLQVLAIGFFAGLEIPLLMNLTSEAKKKMSVLAFDYFGSFAAAILYPLAFVPHLGLVSTSLSISMINILVAIWLGFHFKSKPSRIALEIAIVLSVLFLLLSGPQVETLLRRQILG